MIYYDKLYPLNIFISYKIEIFKSYIEFSCQYDNIEMYYPCSKLDKRYKKYEIIFSKLGTDKSYYCCS